MPNGSKWAVDAVEPHLLIVLDLAGRDPGIATSSGMTWATEIGFNQSLSFCLSAVFASNVSPAGRCRQNMTRTTSLMVILMFGQYRFVADRQQLVEHPRRAKINARTGRLLQALHYSVASVVSRSVPIFRLTCCLTITASLQEKYVT